MTVFKLESKDKRSSQICKFIFSLFQSEGEEDKTIVDIVFPRTNIGNYVWYDANQDGIQNLSESPMLGILVTLYDATTNNDGDDLSVDAGFNLACKPAKVQIFGN